MQCVVNVLHSILCQPPLHFIHDPQSFIDSLLAYRTCIRYGSSLTVKARIPQVKSFVSFSLHCFFHQVLLLMFFWSSAFFFYIFYANHSTLPSISQLASINFATLIHSFVCSSSGSLLSPIFFLCFYFFIYFLWSLFFIIWCDKH